MIRKPDHGAIVAAQHGLKRSPKWSWVQKAFEKAFPYCFCCGKKKKFPNGRGLQTHHIFPYHYVILAGRPDLELDKRNLGNFCEDEKGIVTEDHHLIVGHNGDFRNFSPTAMEDATKTFHGMSKAKILTDPRYIKKTKNRPKLWKDMTAKERKAFRKMLDKIFPFAEQDNG